jgi:high-affinity iron transporter
MPVASFLITLREALEAALILGVVAAYLRKVGHPEVSRYLYLGIASATVASICFAWVLQTIYSGLFDAYESLFEGTTALVASGFLTYMISWMAKNARSIKGELERKLELALNRSAPWSRGNRFHNGLPGRPRDRLVADRNLLC